MQHKTQRPVQFEITPATRDAVQNGGQQPVRELTQVEVLPPHCGGVRAARRRALAPPADYGRVDRY